MNYYDNRDELQKQLLKRIDEVGITYLAVKRDDSDEKDFIYSLGLTNFGLPELICTVDLEANLIQRMMTEIAFAAMGRAPIDNDQVKTILGKRTYCIVPVSDPEIINVYLGQAKDLLGAEEAMQLLISDEQGLYPGEEGYDETLRQVVLFGNV